VIRGSLDRKLKHEIMIYAFIGFLLVCSFIIGIWKFIEMDFVIGFKDFTNPYFHIGLSFNEYSTEDDEYIEQELVIGLFIISIMVVFYKEKDA
jgi:hypothetical protein